MRFSASLAARITRVSLTAMSRATRSADSSSSARGTTSCTDPNWCRVAASTVAAVKNKPPHHVLRHQPGQVGGRAERAALDLGQPELRVVGCDDDVGVADQADATTDAESVDRRDNGDLAFIDRAECVRSSRGWRR